jgi:mannosyltransferase OCH1-like enzyme
MENWITNHMKKKERYMPRLLHLVWVGKAKQPEYLQKHILKWKELMPEWTIRLWTNEDLHNEEVETDVLMKIHEADKGTQKADILKYYIVWKYGGIYVDADVDPTRSLEPIIYMSDLVICHHAEIVWDYIGVGFFAASQHHPVLRKAVDVCLTANLNTSEPHMTTGPRAFGIAVASVPPPHEKYTLLEIDCFYWPEGGMTPNRFGSHFFAKSWDE